MKPVGYDELSHNLQKDIFRLERRQRLFVNRRLAERGFSGISYRYILTIHRHPGTNQDYLAEFYSVDKSRVARVVRELELQGYLDRKPDETNRRCQCLTLTAKGEVLWEAIYDTLSEWGKLVASDMPVEELRLTTDTIERMIRNSDEF